MGRLTSNQLLKRTGLVLICNVFIVNKSHGKTITDNDTFPARLWLQTQSLFDSTEYIIL